MNTINNKNNGNFLLLPKLAKFGPIYHKIWGHFSYRKCTDKQRKRKSFLEVRKMELEG
jgi:hypothetical protein